MSGKQKQYSYSSLGCFEQCPYKYKLVYLDGHYINCPSIATDFGSLIHHIEEEIGKYLKTGLKPDYVLLINDFKTQLKKIETDFPTEFLTEDKSGRTYKEKADYYLNHGIYRLEERLKANPNLEIVGLEKEFFLQFDEYLLHGFIDRLFYDKVSDEYIIEDIKTYPKPIEPKDLKVPLQHVIYSLAVKSIDGKKIRCTYDLPLCDINQAVDPKYLGKGILKLQEVFDELKYSDFEPHPSPLCHWCVFSDTYPNQPDESKGLCPYYCKWTKQKKDFGVNYRWLGVKKHPLILESFKKELESK